METEYRVERLGAVHAGAPHNRERIWILAHAYGEREGRGANSGISPKPEQSHSRMEKGEAGTGPLFDSTQSQHPIGQLADPNVFGRLHGQAEERTAIGGVDAQREPEPGGEEVADALRLGLYKTAKMSEAAWDKRIADNRQHDLSMAICPGTNGGALNPDWVEWLMGWCVHWSSLEPLSHDDFNEWLARTKGGATQVPSDRLRELRNNEQTPPAPQGPEQEQQHAGEHCDPLPGLPCEGTREGGGLGTGQCEGASVCDMREGVSIQPNEARQGVQREVLGEVGQVVGGEKVGEQEQGSDLRTLRDDVSIHPAPTDDMQRIVREQDGMEAPSWWAAEPLNIPRVATGIAKRADRLKAIGNGQVPAVVRLAWNTLYQRIETRLTPTP